MALILDNDWCTLANMSQQKIPSGLSQKQLRASAKDSRAQLSKSTREQYNHRICSTLLSLDCYHSATVIAAYVAVREEVDLHALITQAQADKKTIALPVTKGTRMYFVALSDPFEPELLTLNAWGIPEPLDESGNPIGSVIPSDSLDICLMPLVGFDEQLNRIGMGGGFYDRYFAQAHHALSSQPKRIGVAYSDQQLERIPVEPWDVPMHALVTETGIMSSLK